MVYKRPVSNTTKQAKASKQTTKQTDTGKPVKMAKQYVAAHIVILVCWRQRQGNWSLRKEIRCTSDVWTSSSELILS